MATKKRGRDEGGSGAENKGRVPSIPEEALASGSEESEEEAGHGRGRRG